MVLAILRLAAGIPLLIMLGMVLVVLATVAATIYPYEPFKPYDVTERLAERIGVWAYR